MGLIEAATAAIVGAERRVEIASRNIANVQTPGYKREIAYTEIADAAGHSTQLGSPVPFTQSATFAEPAVLTETGNKLDLAIRGEGYLLLRAGDRYYLSRGGQFMRDGEGTVVDGQGRILQQVGGGDLVLDSDTPEILADGTLLSDGVPIGNIAVYSASPASGAPPLSSSGMDENEMAALIESDAGEVVQGMTERSNVILSDEMIGLVRTQRMAEAGAQLMRAYDQLIGQAVSTFGRRG